MSSTAWLLLSLHNLDHGVARGLDQAIAGLISSLSALVRRGLVESMLTQPLALGRDLGHEVTQRILVSNGDVAAAILQLRLLDLVVVHRLNVVCGRVV